jgi:hypothetical protein
MAAMMAAMRATELLEPDLRADGAPASPFDALIGSWNIRARWFAPDGTTSREAEGEWHFSWILGGWGVQDVLFVKGASASERGTSMRCYDPTADVWRVVWMMPKGNEFVSLEARIESAKVIQEGISLRGDSRQRWTFLEVTSSSFLWQGESSVDGGVSWRLDQEMRGARQ